ncbi:MAG: hypothetical protein LBP85_02620, partial [Prevotellaceae bacterium]|jgi:hypothetical protein|nr:hypothetical protein [Prevotellaceae bacterium]
LSSNTNIPEATAAGYPDNFKGVFVQEAVIGLPSKWFNSVNNTTLQIAGYNMLIGTGGISGKIALEAVGGGAPGANAFLNAKIGNFTIGFNSFDITFRQNVITESNIRGRLTIQNFKNSANQPLQIELAGSFSQDGDFNLTASVSNSISANLFNFVNFDFHTFELGKADGKFYLGTSCDIWFPSNSVMNKIIGSQKISLPKIRIYDSGRMEIVGGEAFIPANISLNLGPVDVSVTGINFGSHQQKYNGVERQYNYWGFDGAISIDPLGIDVRGEGLKYYYTVDNDEHGGAGDSFIHIQTLEVDLIIPGSASPSAAVAIIHGMLSIPSPGEDPKEYQGEISLKLPKMNIAAGAGMRLMPKEPAFIIDASVQLPAPVPVGFVSIYEFRLLLGYRYVAEKEAVGLVSGVNTWYDYYTYPPRGVHISKFSPPNKTKDYSTPFSLGAGAVLGTNLDGGKILSARVMMLLSLPTLFMIDGKASLLSSRIGLDTNKEPPFFAFVAWGDSAIEAGLGADFKLPANSGSIFSLYANVESKFPLRGGAWYINAGTKDKPVSATLFKGVLNLNAQAYLMLSSQGISLGAGVSFNLNKSFAGIKVRLYAWVEVGGSISFEKPQLGGYLYFGGGIEVNVWRLIYVSFSLSVYLSAEAPAPFKLYASLNVKGKIKVLFFKIKFSIKLELSWETNKQVDTSPICPLPYLGAENRTDELVKAVHMLTNEVYDINFLQMNTLPANANNITKIIPADSYIDIKTIKGLINRVSANIGGGTISPANYMDKIPPSAVVKGKQLRQVVHKYSMEKVEIFAWDNQSNQWVEYHPFAALTEEGEDRIDAKKLKIGSWQLINKQYDTVRLLAANPFSYTDAGEPGWVVPEYLGLTGEVLFCEENIEMKILNFLNKGVNNGDKVYIENDGIACANNGIACVIIRDVNNEDLGDLVYRYNDSNHHYINGAWFNLVEEYLEEQPTDEQTPELLSIEPVDNISELPKPTMDKGIDINTFVIKNSPDEPHDFARSLYFSNYNRLLIMFPENIAEIRLLLTSCAPSVTVRFYKGFVPDDGNSSNIQYEQVAEIIKTGEELAESEIVYSYPDNPIIRIIIEPEHSDFEEITAIKEQISGLFAKAYGYSNGTLQFSDEDQILYDELTDRLNALRPIDGKEEEETAICDTTSLQQIRWYTVERYQYKELLPSIEEKREDQTAMAEAVNKYIQPVWRPATKYCIHFQLNDEVSYNGTPKSSGVYKYYYGFKTTGSVGHYQGTGNNIGKGLNLLEKYIDFNRSYPNADGNLLQSKPLFWGHYECKINIFFTKAFICHLLNNWPEYGNLVEMGGSLNIKIKDPVSDVLIEYPLQEDVDVAYADEQDIVWQDDDNPPSPLYIHLINNLLANYEQIPCDISGIGMLKPAAMFYSITLANLKPLKLYTALLYNAFNPNGTELSDANNAEVHRFVFQTSRYENFEEQVNSCILKDDSGNEKMAVFELLTDMPASGEADVYQTVWNLDNDVLSDLALRYSHNFDKLMEGIFCFKPLEAATTTEFNIIRSRETGNIVAVLVRNPEPFNDPKIPIEQITDTIVVADENANVDTGFKTLYSKDYSQAIIVKNGSPITENSLFIRFRYKLWNGSIYNVEKTIQTEININQ